MTPNKSALFPHLFLKLFLLCSLVPAQNCYEVFFNENEALKYLTIMGELIDNFYHGITERGEDALSVLGHVKGPFEKLTTAGSGFVSLDAAILKVKAKMQGIHWNAETKKLEKLFLLRALFEIFAAFNRTVQETVKKSQHQLLQQCNQYGKKNAVNIGAILVATSHCHHGYDVYGHFEKEIEGKIGVKIGQQTPPSSIHGIQNRLGFPFKMHFYALINDLPRNYLQLRHPGDDTITIGPGKRWDGKYEFPVTIDILAGAGATHTDTFEFSRLSTNWMLVRNYYGEVYYREVKFYDDDDGDFCNYIIRVKLDVDKVILQLLSHSGKEEDSDLLFGIASLRYLWEFEQLLEGKQEMGDKPKNSPLKPGEK